MFIKQVKKPNGKTAVLIVESYRKDGKATHKTLKNLGIAQDDKELEITLKFAVEFLAKMKESTNKLLPIFDPIEFYAVNPPKPVPPEFKVNPTTLREEVRLVCGSQEVFGQTYKQMNFDKILETDYKEDQWNQVLKQCVLSRIVNPVSKLKTSEQLVDYFGIDISANRL